MDFFRGIFVFFGAVGHFYFTMWSPTGVELQPSFPVAVFLFNIVYGIAAFFPISGFLITSILLRKVEKKSRKFQQINITGFYLFRVARIFPALLLLCLLNLLLAGVNYPEFQITAPLTWGTLLTYVFTFRTNVLFLESFHHLFSWGILWSLAIEEVFYLFYPWICAIFRSFYVIILVLCLVIGYGVWYRSQAASAYIVLRSYWGCFDQLALGCLAAFLAHMEVLPRARRTLWICGLFLLLIVASLTNWVQNYVCGPTLIGLSVSMILLGFSSTSVKSVEKKNTQLPQKMAQKWRQIKYYLMLPACVLGILSYEFYLFHAFLFLLLKPIAAFIILRTGWTWHVSLIFLSLEMCFLFVLSWGLFFYGTNPLRKKIITMVLNGYKRQNAITITS